MKWGRFSDRILGSKFYRVPPSYPGCTSSVYLSQLKGHWGGGVGHGVEGGGSAGGTEVVPLTTHCAGSPQRLPFRFEDQCLVQPS